MSYLGSKAASGAYQAIISLMPPHNTYIETHLGGGAIMSFKPPVFQNIGIDLDPKALDFARRNRLESYPAKLKLHCGCAHAFLKQYEFTGEELVYCDPPYLHSTRTSQNRYNYEYTEADHIELITLLKSLNAQVILSGYPSPLYHKMLSDWNTQSFQVMSRGGVRTEQIWFNYEADNRYWATYAGQNFRQRQHIKRKAERWANNYQKMPPDEQRAILSALLNVSRESTHNV